jgi:hypothetical protein
MANGVTEHSNREAISMILTHQTAPSQFVEPRCIFAVCRELPGKCETVSRWVRRAAWRIAVQAMGSPLHRSLSVTKIRRANVAQMSRASSSTHSTPDVVARPEALPPKQF